MKTSKLPSPEAPPLHAPLMMAGCCFGGLWRILRQHGFRVRWGCWPALCLTLLLGLVQNFLRGLQGLLLGRQIDATPIPDAPIIIIGHWRTGTTLLQTFLSLDKRFVAPNSYECFAPNHFVLTERIFMKLFGWIAPFRRPMDNMLTSFKSPQEDEFALALRGESSLYWSMIFPNEPPEDLGLLDTDGLPPAQRQRWKQTVTRFLIELTCLHGKRIVLKNPLHAARIEILLELFPNARFINIVRDPFVVFPSTLHMHRTSMLTFGWQKPTFNGLEDRVLKMGLLLHEKLKAGQHLIPHGQYHELRYEDLIADPQKQMQQLYSALDLTGFEEYAPALMQYWNSLRDYQTNRYQISPEMQETVRTRWAPLLHDNGYAR